MYPKTYVELKYGAFDLTNEVSANRLGLVVQLSWRVAPPWSNKTCKKIYAQKENTNIHSGCRPKYWCKFLISQYQKDNDRCKNSLSTLCKLQASCRHAAVGVCALFICVISMSIWMSILPCSGKLYTKLTSKDCINHTKFIQYLKETRLTSKSKNHDFSFSFLQ